MQKEDFILVTWGKYHSENYISAEIKYPKFLIYSIFQWFKKILKYFDCSWESKVNNQKLIWEICGKKFQSELKEYYKYEIKPLLNCIKYAKI